MAIKRISIGPGEIAGYFSRLQSGFNAASVDCEHFVMNSNKFAYNESDYFLKAVFNEINRLREKDLRYIHSLLWLFELITRFAVLAYALIRCDVFIFSGFESFFRFYELPLLKFFGKKVLVVYLGSDSRPPIFSGKHLDDVSEVADYDKIYVETTIMVEKIRRVEKYADIIICHTATAQFFKRDFVRFISVGMPIEIGEFVQGDFRPNSNSVRILHAPSRPIAKGSEVFRRIIKELQTEGYLIEFVELIGVPNTVVLQELQNCDFVLDELYSDTPLAMLATEAAYYGKPVVVGGDYAVQFGIDNPDLIIPPSLYVEPKDIKQAIRKMIDNVQFRIDLGLQAKNFISDRWNSVKVAENYLRLIDGDIPESWVCSPSKLAFYFGWGLSKDNWRHQVGEYVDLFGSNALQLNHNPLLRNAVLSEIDGSKVVNAE